MTIVKELDAHIWEREENEHYVEPSWCSKRLFEEEKFTGNIYDPACGFGTIVKEATSAGFNAEGSDLVNRGYGNHSYDFFELYCDWDNIVSNPPFNIAANFTLKALKVAKYKVAMIFPVARLNAAHWIKNTPLKTVWLMTPRPSMPPGHVIAKGEKPGGGKMDYCWLVWEHNYIGPSELKWLRRDK